MHRLELAAKAAELAEMAAELLQTAEEAAAFAAGLAEVRATIGVDFLACCRRQLDVALAGRERTTRRTAEGHLGRYPTTGVYTIRPADYERLFGPGTRHYQTAADFGAAVPNSAAGYKPDWAIGRPYMRLLKVSPGQAVGSNGAWLVAPPATVAGDVVSVLGFVPERGQWLVVGSTGFMSVPELDAHKAVSVRLVGRRTADGAVVFVSGSVTKAARVPSCASKNETCMSLTSRAQPRASPASANVAPRNPPT